VDEQGASTKTQMEERGLQNVERGTGHLGGILEHCQEHAGKQQRRVRPHLELNLAKDVKDNKKAFFKYIRMTTRAGRCHC